MEPRQPPKDDHDAITQIWYAIFGTNGGEGIIARLKRFEDRGRNSWVIAKDIALLMIASGSMVAAFWAVFVIVR